MLRSKILRLRAPFLAIFLFAVAASAATVPAVLSSRSSSPVRLDGKIDEWASVARITDDKAGVEFAFQNDARNLYVLVVIKRPEAMQSAEATGMTVLGRPAGSRKPAKGVLFLTRDISADGYIVWRESQGAILTEAEKAGIRKTPLHPVSLAFAIDAKGSSYGPLRRQTDIVPPDSSVAEQEAGPAFEFRIPLASPDLVAGAIGGTPGAIVRISFEWGGTDRKNLSTQAGRESPDSRSGYVSGTGRTWGQEYLDNFDSMSRPTMGTKKFSFAVDVRLADVL
jgi:hypothetical protein